MNALTLLELVRSKDLVERVDVEVSLLRLLRLNAWGWSSRLPLGRLTNQQCCLLLVVTQSVVVFLLLAKRGPPWRRGKVQSNTQPPTLRQDRRDCARAFQGRETSRQRIGR